MQQKPLFFWLGVALALHLMMLAWDRDAGPPRGGPAPLAIDLRPAGEPDPVMPPVATAPPPLSAPPPPRQSRPLPAPSPPPAPAASVAKTAPPRVTPPAPAGSEAPQPTPEANVDMKPSASPGAERSDLPAAATPLGPSRAEPALVEAHPRYDENPSPAYPRLAEQRGWEGEVLLRVRIAASGKVLEAAVQESSGYPILDRAALTAVRNWRFEPGRRGGLAVESQVLVPVTFRLRRS